MGEAAVQAGRLMWRTKFGEVPVETKRQRRYDE
jgi:hypothetical protein